MPRGMVYGRYETDTGGDFARLVDADEILEASRGWTVWDPDTDNPMLLPIKAKPRRVYGVSPTTGRRGTAICANVLATLWTGATSSFTVEGNDGSPDVMNVTRRVGESFARAHA